MELSPPTVAREASKQASFCDAAYLRSQSRWIRDELDPVVARDGPDAVCSDDLLNLDDFLRRLADARVDRDVVRISRIHSAILDITGRGTRWPKKIIDRCLAVEAAWQDRLGPLKAIGFPLFEVGGRLHGICRPEDLSNGEKLLLKWLTTPGLKGGPSAAMRSGDLGFNPGDWWINASFALYAGIIDSSDPQGGITADTNGAYAVLMAGNDEAEGSTPDAFTYRARDVGRGRYRLTAGTPESRCPVRILRSHTLRNFCAPRVGIRYKGLYQVTGWTVKLNKATKGVDYLISFERITSQTSSDVVSRRPFVDEVEDYIAYKQARRGRKEKK